MSFPSLAAALALSLAAGAALAAEAPEGLVKLDAATQKRIGVVTAPLAAARRSAAATGFARVIDTAPLALLDSDLSGAIAAASASRAEATRAKALHAADATLSAKAVEAAEAQARTDDAKLLLLRRRLGLEWGPAFAKLSDAARGRLIAELAAGRTALVRIDAMAPPPGLKSAEIELGAGGSAHAVVLGPARTSDPRLQTVGLIAQVTGPQAMNLPVGLSAPVTLSAGAAQAGVVLPRSALYRSGGETTVFIRKDAGSFERREVEGGMSDPSGLFAPKGFAPGEAVVVEGAAALAAAVAPAPAEAD
jgi:hypothetical protein